MNKASVEIWHDNFQNYKRYNIPRKAQLVIADIPYNIGVDAYASNPMWYKGGDNKNGESEHAKANFFNGDGDFKIAEFMHFCSKMLIKEPKEKGKAPAMIVFCAFEQIPTVVEYGRKYGFNAKTGVEHPTVVSGGFPCQPHSLAGKRLASDDERDLWDELFRVYCETGARWLVGENVGGLLSSENGRFFGRVLRDLAQRGCHVWWYCFPAHAAGIPFWGERIAIVAAARGVGRKSLDVFQKIKPTFDHCGCLGEAQARSELVRLYVARTERDTGSGVERNDDGIPTGLDELKCYGNAVVPQQFYPVFRAIAEVEKSLWSTTAPST